MTPNPHFRRSFVTVLTVIALAVTALAPALAAQEPPALKAPTGRYAAPPTFLLLRLGGNRTTFYYTPGSLDRAANLQHRLEEAARGFERWAGQQVEYTVYVLGRREWQEAGYDVTYGLPLRVGERGLVAPARGDAGTVDLWLDLLGGRLPNIAGTPILGTPEELASLVTTDVLLQVMAGEILAESAGIRGDEPWVGPTIAHLASYTIAVRAGTDRPEDLAAFFQQLGARRELRSLAARDVDGPLDLDDWIWFQARFHFGARALYDDMGKDALAKMIKQSKKKGGLEADHLRRKHKRLDLWLTDSFAAVSRRP